MALGQLLSETVESVLTGEIISPDIIGINFTAGVYRMDSPSIGVAHWNNIDGHVGKNLRLKDSSGETTDARLTFESASCYAGFGHPETLNGAVNQLYCGGLVGNDTMSEVRVAVSGIPYRRYEVFVFASADTHDRSTLSITDGRTTFYYRSDGQSNVGATRLLRTQSQKPRTPTTGPAQYQVFQVRGALFEVVTGGSRHCILSNNIFGLLIVRTTRSPDIVRGTSPDDTDDES